jgi:hypothetical protein
LHPADDLAAGSPGRLRVHQDDPVGDTLQPLLGLAHAVGEADPVASLAVLFPEGLAQVAVGDAARLG